MCATRCRWLVARCVVLGMASLACAHEAQSQAPTSEPDEPAQSADSPVTPASPVPPASPEPSSADAPPAAPPSPTGGVIYSGVDAATVRIFAVGGIETLEVQGARATRMLAVPESSHGTGVVIDPAGVILTAAHVVQGARHLAVRWPNGGGVLPAIVVGSDAALDYAILVVDPPSPLAAMEMPTSPIQLAVRQTIDAVGYPLDATREQPQSTRGIISAAMDDGRLQLGISVNPGNSGGPLVDQHDNLVGIVVARGDPREGVQGIGVAVPMAPIQRAYEFARAQGQLARGRATLHDEAPVRRKAAEVVDALLRLGGADAFREAASVADGVASPDRLRHFASVSTGVNDALLLAMLAAYCWDASVVAQERAGGFTSPAQMPDGPAKRLALEALDLARRMAQRAADLDATLRGSAFIARVLGSEAPSSWGQASGGQGSNGQGNGMAWTPADAPAPAEPSEPSGWFPVLQLGYSYSRLSGANPAWGDATTSLHVSAALPLVLSGDPESAFRVALMAGLGASIGVTNAPSERFDLQVFAQVGGALRYGVRKAFLLSAYWTPTWASEATRRNLSARGDRNDGVRPLAFRVQIGAAFARWSLALEVGFLRSLGEPDANRVWFGPRAGVTF